MGRVGFGFAAAGFAWLGAWDAIGVGMLTVGVLDALIVGAGVPPVEGMMAGVAGPIGAAAGATLACPEPDWLVCWTEGGCAAPPKNWLPAMLA